MSHTALIRMTWPEAALWENRKAHWAQRARAKKAYRTEAWAKATEQSVKRIKSVPTLTFTFHPPKGPGRKPDCHNIPQTQKAAIDGIADALGMDDAPFKCVWPDELGERVEGGCVMVEITE